MVLEVSVRTMNTIPANEATLFSVFLSSFRATILVASLLSNFKASFLANMSGKGRPRRVWCPLNDYDHARLSASHDMIYLDCIYNFPA